MNLKRYFTVLLTLAFISSLAFAQASKQDLVTSSTRLFVRATSRQLPNCSIRE
jgi:hypothetical protein